MKVLYEKDCDLNLLKDKQICIVGYGSQGHAHALNLRDSGFNVIVGLHSQSESIEAAKKAGFQVKDVASAVKDADVIMLLVPDEIMPSVYNNDVKPNLKSNSYLGIAHGFNIHYNLVEVNSDINVFMVAPKSPGHLVRRQYEMGFGVPCLYTAYQDVSGNTLELSKSYASAIGGGRAGLIETTVKEECETDLFGEQVVLCGGVVELMKVGFEVLVEAGYSKEAAYFECVNEMKLIIDLIYENGFNSMNESISNTAEYGEYVVGPRIITEDTRLEMKQILKEIQDGTFAKNFVLDSKSGSIGLKANRRLLRDHSIESVGHQLRSLMKK